MVDGMRERGDGGMRGRREGGGGGGGGRGEEGSRPGTEKISHNF